MWLASMCLALCGSSAPMPRCCCISEVPAATAKAQPSRFSQGALSGRYSPAGSALAPPAGAGQLSEPADVARLADSLPRAPRSVFRGAEARRRASRADSPPFGQCFFRRAKQFGRVRVLATELNTPVARRLFLLLVTGRLQVAGGPAHASCCKGTQRTPSVCEKVFLGGTLRRSPVPAR
ncbi:unnamed protein product [Amoebophrya sp. A120]|nr:unnamed protein product [Amoebophrya sp. A120]|eukprot:GSA120T00014933001.1